MIGVIPKTNEPPVVEEFFQLFKTPWEIYREGQDYDVVIASGGAIPQLDAGLVVIDGTEIQASDRLSGLKALARQADAIGEFSGTVVMATGQH